MQLLGGLETAKLKKMMFEYDSFNSQGSQGEAILHFLNMPRDMLFRA